MSARTDTTIIFLYKVIGAITAFLAALYLPTWTTDEFLGKYALAATFATTLASLAVYGLNLQVMKGAAARTNAQEHNSTLTTIWSTATAHILAIAPITALLFALIISEGTVFFVALYFYVAFSALKAPYLMVKGKYRLNSFYDDVMRPAWGLILGALALITAGISTNTPVIETAAFAAALLIAGSLIFMIKSATKDFQLTPRTQLYAPRLYIINHYSALTGVLGILISQVDRLYTPFTIGYTATATLYTASTLTFVINYFNQAIITRQTPTLVRLQEEQDWSALTRQTRRSTRASLAFAMLCTGSIITASTQPWHHPILSDPKFWYATIIIIGSQTVSLIFGFGSTLMLYSDRQTQKTLLLFLILSLTLSIATGIVLSLLFGIIGAALAVGTGLVLSRLLPYLHYRRIGHAIGAF